MTKSESESIVMRYGGLEGAELKLNRLCILKWITPEILELTEAIKIFKLRGCNDRDSEVQKEG